MLINTFQGYLEMLALYFQFTDRMTNYVENNQAFNLNLFGYIVTYLRFILLYWICSKALNRNPVFARLRSVVYIYIIFAVLQVSMPFLYRLMWMFEIVPILFLAEFIGLCITKKVYIIYLCNLNGSPSVYFHKSIISLVIVFFCLLSLITSRSFQEEENGSRFYIRFVPYSSVIYPQKNQEREYILSWYGRDY